VCVFVCVCVCVCVCGGCVCVCVCVCVCGGWVCVCVGVYVGVKVLWVLLIICMRQLQAVLVIDSSLPYFSGLTFISSN